MGGDADSLTEQFDWQRLSDLSGGPERFMIETPRFVNRREQAPTVSYKQGEKQVERA